MNWLDPFVLPWIDLLGKVGLVVLIGMAGVVAAIASSPRRGQARYVIPMIWAYIGGLIAAFVTPPFLSDLPNPELGVVPVVLSLAPLVGWLRGVPGPPADYWPRLARQIVLFNLLVLPLDWATDRCIVCQTGQWEQVSALKPLMYGVFLIVSIRRFHPAQWVPHWTWGLPQALAMNLPRFLTPWLLAYTPSLGDSYRLRDAASMSVVENLYYWIPISAGILALFYGFWLRNQERRVH